MVLLVLFSISPIELYTPRRRDSVRKKCSDPTPLNETLMYHDNINNVVLITVDNPLLIEKIIYINVLDEYKYYIIIIKMRCVH